MKRRSHPLDELRSRVREIENALVDAEAAIVGAHEALENGRPAEAREILYEADLSVRIFLDAWRGEGIFDPKEIEERRRIVSDAIAAAIRGKRP